MKLKIYRGANQIGGNIIEIATDTTKIILDCGKNLPPLDSMSGVIEEDTINIDGLTCGESKYDGVFITHYHADHCGLIDRINKDIPVYANEETATVLGLISDFINTEPPRISKLLTAGQEEIIGDIIVLPIYVWHSAKGAMMFLIKADGQKLLYTGDFNHIDETYYSLIGEVDALLCEGTNIDCSDGFTEKDVEREAAKIMRETENQVFVLCSTTNIDRINAIENACHSTGRTIAVDPFMNSVVSRVASKHVRFWNKVGFVPHYINPEKSPRVHKYLAEEIYTFEKTEVVAKMTNLTFMVRQTMGEFLKKVDKIKPLKGSVLIYSMWNGYKANAKTQEFLTLCESLGIKIVDLHASGHAYQTQLQYAVERIKPRVVVPIHTESAEAFGAFCDNVRIVGDREVYEI